MEGIGAPLGDDFKERAASWLWQELKNVIDSSDSGPGGSPLPEPIFLSMQRWGSGFKGNVLPQHCLIDSDQKLAACGDFCMQSNVEGAILSGLAAAHELGGLL